MEKNRQGVNRDPAAYLFWGDDEFAVQTAAKAAVNRLVPVNEQTFRLEVIDGRFDIVARAVEALSACRMAAQSPSLLGDAKVVWLRDAAFLGDSPAGRSEDVRAQAKALADLINHGLAAGITLVVSAALVDRRTSLYKTFEKKGEIHDFLLASKPAEAMRQGGERIRSEFRAVGLDDPSESLVAELYDRIGLNSRQIAVEVEKLKLFLGDRTKVTPDDIRAIVSATRNVLYWDFEDAFGMRNIALCLSVLRQLIAQKEEPVGLIMSIERRIRDLMVLREMLDNKWLVMSGHGRGSNVAWQTIPPEVVKVFDGMGDRDPRKIHPFRIGKLAEQSGNYTRREIQAAQVTILAAHEQLVSSSAPGPVLLELALMRIMRRKAMR